MPKNSAFVSGYGFSDTTSSAKSDAPSGAGRGHFSHQTVRETPRNPHPNVAPRRQLDARGHGKVHHLDLRSPPNPLSPRRILPFHHHLKRLPNVPLIAPRPNLLLPVIHHRQSPRLLRIGEGVIQQQSRSIRPRRVLKRKDAVIPNQVHQRKRLFKLPFRLARKPNNPIAAKRNIPPRPLHPRDALPGP